MAAPCAGNIPALQLEATLKALLQIRINGIAVVPPLHASSRDRLGLALYPHASMLSHACVPNVDLRFEGKWLSVLAARDIMCGEGLYHSYGPQVQGKQPRQASWRRLRRSALLVG